MNWGAVLEPLADALRVLALDQPGFGFTELRDEDEFQPRVRAEFVVEFIEALDVESVALAGNSEGGFVAMYIALTRPELVDKLIFVNSGSASRPTPEGDPVPHTDTDGPPTLEETREHLEIYREQYYVRLENHPFWQELTDEKVNWVHDIETDLWEINNERDATIRSNWKVSNQALEYDGKHIYYSADQVEVPSLLTWSTQPFFTIGFFDEKGFPYQDGERPFDSGLNLFQQLPEAEFHLFQNAKHHVMTDRRDRWVDVVVDYTTSNE